MCAEQTFETQLGRVYFKIFSQLGQEKAKKWPGRVVYTPKTEAMKIVNFHQDQFRFPYQLNYHLNESPHVK